MRRRATLVAAAASALLADQLTKAAVTAALAPGERAEVVGPLAFHHTRNTGVAFSLFAGSGTILAVVASIALAALVVVLPRLQLGPPGSLGIGLVLGGAAGNLVDRIRLGHVTDFVEVSRWPEFNVADACITVGVGLVLVASFRR